MTLNIYFSGFTHLYHTLIVRLSIAYLNMFLNAVQYKAFTGRYKILVDMTLESSHGITGLNSITINLQDYAIGSPTDIALENIAGLCSHEYTHALISFLNLDPALQQKLHEYDLPLGSDPGLPL